MIKFWTFKFRMNICLNIITREIKPERDRLAWFYFKMLTSYFY